MEKVLVKSIDQVYEDLEKGRGKDKLKRKRKNSWHEAYDRTPEHEVEAIRKVRSHDVYGKSMKELEDMLDKSMSLEGDDLIKFWSEAARKMSSMKRRMMKRLDPRRKKRLQNDRVTGETPITKVTVL